MDLGTHALHLLRTLFGPVREIWADFANQSGIYPEVEDYGVAHLRFASGVFGEVEAAWTQTGGIGGLTIIGSQAAGCLRFAPAPFAAPLIDGYSAL